ncbi:hypothetical protein NPIL_281811, partial [Nephila pilipes]
TNTKYVGERWNISLHSCTFGPSPVDNHRYALVEDKKRRADKEVTGCFSPYPLFWWSLSPNPSDWLFPAKSFGVGWSQSALSVLCICKVRW